MINPELIQAYRDTEYIVVSDEAGGADGQFVLTIGVASLPLMSLYKHHDARCAAFITACNPRSRRKTQAANSALQDSLRTWIDARGYFFLPGVGRAKTGPWPAEPSFLVLGISREQANDAGCVHDQNAIVWCDHDATPQLVLLGGT